MKKIKLFRVFLYLNHCELGVGGLKKTCSSDVEASIDSILMHRFMYVFASLIQGYI